MLLLVCCDGRCGLCHGRIRSNAKGVASLLPAGRRSGVEKHACESLFKIQNQQSHSLF